MFIGCREVFYRFSYGFQCVKLMNVLQLIVAAAAAAAYLPTVGTPAGLIHRPPPMQQTIHELTIPNEQIGCIIGRAGCKINEIRLADSA